MERFTSKYIEGSDANQFEDRLNNYLHSLPADIEVFSINYSQGSNPAGAFIYHALVVVKEKLV